MEKGAMGTPDYSPHSSFLRHSRAVGVLWGVFSMCFTIIVIVVFIQPHWIGAARETGPGHMGLWRWCAVTSSPVTSHDSSLSAGGGGGSDVICTGELQDIPHFLPLSTPTPTQGAGSISNTPFKSASLLTALAVLFTVLAVVSMLLFMCVRPSRVYHIAGWMQIIAGCLLGAAVCVYPLGFSSSEVRHLCGPTARHYNLGECNLRWAYVLAIIGVFDAIVLAALALVLATRNVKPQDNIYNAPQMYKGGNFGHDTIAADGVSISASRKSLNLQPVMVMAPEPNYGRQQQQYTHM